MTDTQDLSKTFPAGTAAGRIDHSVRALTAGFRYRLLDLESSQDLAVAEEAEAVVNDVCRAQENLARALRVAGRFMQRMDLDVEGRDVEEEDRALARVLAELHQLTQSEWPMTAEVRELLGSRDVRWAQGLR